MQSLRTRSRSAPAQRGFALFLGMIFLLMLTLVAVTAMRGTSLELNMANNTANQEIAFEGAESGRMAFVRSIRDHVACNFRWGQSARLVGGGSACISGCTQGDGQLANTANYVWEPRLRVQLATLGLDYTDPAESTPDPITPAILIPRDPTTYIDRFRLDFGSVGVARIGAVMIPATVPAGNAAAMAQGYEQATGGAKGGAVRYVEVVSRATVANARANVAGHYRLMMREASPDTCVNDLVIGSGI